MGASSSARRGGRHRRCLMPRVGTIPHPHRGFHFRASTAPPCLPAPPPSDSRHELFSKEPTAGRIPSGILLSGNEPRCDPEPAGTKQESDDSKETINQKPAVQDFMAMEEEVRIAIPERPSALPTICEVPEELAEGNKSAYTPNAVCIGPIFDSERTRPSMVRLERYKLCCVRKLIMAGSAPAAAASIDGWSPGIHGRLLRNCFDSMMHLVPRIRAAYSYNNSSSSDGAAGEEDTASKNGDEQLATKMLVDGCFVLHRLLKHADNNNNNGGIVDDDWTQTLGRCWVWETVTRDLLLVSNQVPFFVLRRLLDQLPRLNNVDIVKCGLQLLSPLHPRRRMHSWPIQNVHHLLHLFYLSIDLPEPQRRQQKHHDHQPPATMTGRVRSVKDLFEAGVHVLPRRDVAVSSFLDIRYRDSFLEIPPLQLFDYSEPLFRNLIAFEQTFPDTPGRVTAYAIFMDCLIKTAEDARRLHSRGVLVSHMSGTGGHDGASTMGFFRRLCAGVHTSPDRNYLVGVMEVCRAQRRFLPRWRAFFSRYYTEPWVILSALATIVLLGLAVLQTLYTVYPYYKPAGAG